MNWQASEFNKELAAAAESFDHDRAAVLCEKLVIHLRDRDEPYPIKHAQKVLNIVRKKRYSDLLQRVADSLIQNEQDAPVVRRQYAQSQLDQSNLTAAISTLKSLEADTAPDGRQEDPKEHAEARGLLGRTYKQLYVDADNSSRSRNRCNLETAIAHYQGVYENDPTEVWQGINSMALIRRADTDGIELDGVAGLKLKADSMATEILARITNKDLDEEASTWDFAAALEACVGLDKHTEAVEWLSKYLKSDYTDAFELGSTYRQLTEVWKLNTAEPPGDRILPAIKAALLDQEGSEIEIEVKEAAQEKLNELAQDPGYEKVLGPEGFRSLKWFQMCMMRARSVARIENNVGDPIGTGFVVRGGDFKPDLGDELLILTNAHVISSDPSVSRALRPEKAVLNFELWNNADAPEFTVKELWTSPPDQLDATLVRPSPALERVEPMPVTGTLPLADGKQRAYIIGHPEGRKLSFSIHDNYLLDYDKRLLHYRSPTEPGSSGSPVFNDDWELIGLHHRGLSKMPRLNGKEGTYPANEGIWIQAIVESLKSAQLG